MQVMSFYTIIEGEKTLQKGDTKGRSVGIEMLLSLLIGWFLKFYFYFTYMYICAHVSGNATGVQKEAGYPIPWCRSSRQL